MTYNKKLEKIIFLLTQEFETRWRMNNFPMKCTYKLVNKVHVIDGIIDHKHYIIEFVIFAGKLNGPRTVLYRRSWLSKRGVRAMRKAYEDLLEETITEIGFIGLLHMWQYTVESARERVTDPLNGTFVPEEFKDYPATLTETKNR